MPSYSTSSWRKEMPKRKSGKRQRDKRKGGIKAHKSPVTLTDKSNEESSYSQSKSHEVDQTDMTGKFTTEFSSNWKTLAKQLGLDRSRKEHHQDSIADHSRVADPTRSHDSKVNGHKRRKDPFSKHFREKTATIVNSSVGTSSRKRERSAQSRQRAEIWFDDVPLEMVEGEPVPKRSKTSPSARLVTGKDTTAGKCVSLDCEMVGTGRGGEFSMLARCSIVNHHGNMLFDSHVAPMDRVTDYRTRFSGIRPRDLVGAPDFKSVQKSVSDIITGRKLVGHGIQNDLKVLLLSHPKKDIRDTSKYKPFRQLSNGGTPSLRKVASEILGMEIHDSEHSSIEDARIAMRLYQLHKKEWEQNLKARHKHSYS